MNTTEQATNVITRKRKRKTKIKDANKKRQGEQKDKKETTTKPNNPFEDTDSKEHSGISEEMETKEDTNKTK